MFSFSLNQAEQIQDTKLELVLKNQLNLSLFLFKPVSISMVADLKSITCTCGLPKASMESLNQSKGFREPILRHTQVGFEFFAQTSSCDLQGSSKTKYGET